MLKLERRVRVHFVTLIELRIQLGGISGHINPKGIAKLFLPPFRIGKRPPGNQDVGQID